MQSRIDRFCELVANPLKNSDDIIHFLADENVDINDRHSAHQSRPVDFAAQSGSLSSLRYLLEEAHADISESSFRSFYNLLIWASSDNTQAEVRKYLIDPERKIWRRFEDGTTDLHVAALTGNLAAIEAALAENPDRIGELAKGKYNLLYWAQRGDHAELQVHLLKLMQQYREKYANDKDSMRSYHLGMTYYHILMGESYAEFDAYLDSIKDIADFPHEKMTECNANLRQIGKDIDNKVAEQKKYIDTLVDLKNSISKETLNDWHKRKVFLRVISLYELGLKARKAVYKKIQTEDKELEDQQLNSLAAFTAAGLVSLRLAEYEIKAFNTNEDRLAKLLDQSYRFFERGLDLVNDIEVEGKKNSFIMNLTLCKLNLESSRQRLLHLEKDLVEKTQKTFIKHNPLEDFVSLATSRKSSPALIEAFLQDKNIDINAAYHGKSVVEHIVDEGGNVSVLNYLIVERNASLDMSDKKNALNLLQRARKKNISADIRNYLLDPQRKVWEKFNDGTTDLHAHAFAGRTEEMTALLAAAPERMEKMNRSKENVFYWASFSSQAEELKTLLTTTSFAYLGKLAKDQEWEKILSFYHSMEKCLKQRLKSESAIQLLQFNLDFINGFSPADDKLGNRQKVLNFLNMRLAEACRNFTSDSFEEEPKYAELALQALHSVDEDSKEKQYLQLACEENIYLVWVERADRKRMLAGLNMEEGDFCMAMEYYNLADESYQQALQALKVMKVEPCDEELKTGFIKKILHYRDKIAANLRFTYECLGMMPVERVKQVPLRISPAEKKAVENGKEEKTPSHSSYAASLSDASHSLNRSASLSSGSRSPYSASSSSASASSSSSQRPSFSSSSSSSFSSSSSSFFRICAEADEILNSHAFAFVDEVDEKEEKKDRSYSASR